MSDNPYRTPPPDKSITHVSVARQAGGGLLLLAGMALAARVAWLGYMLSPLTDENFSRVVVLIPFGILLGLIGYGVAFRVRIMYLLVASFALMVVSLAIIGVAFDYRQSM